ncbi:MAG: phasin family protein [Dinoroseobacter sp.]|nr:phasin family protein [Dinoroseobacter sp.]
MTTKTTSATARKSAAKEPNVAAVEKPVAVATNVFSSLAKSGSKTLEGIFEIDKALLGYARASITGYVEHGKASFAAKDINTLIDLQAAFLHSAIETGAANTREVVELARTKSTEAYAPIKDVIDTYRSRDAA